MCRGQGAKIPWKFNFLKIKRKICSEKNPFREKSIRRKILQENWLSEKSPSGKNPSENGHSANHPTIDELNTKSPPLHFSSLIMFSKSNSFEPQAGETRVDTHKNWAHRAARLGFCIWITKVWQVPCLSKRIM